MSRVGIALCGSYLKVGEQVAFSTEVEEIFYDRPEFFLKHYRLIRQKQQPRQKLMVRVEGLVDE